MSEKILKLWGKGPLKINDFETYAFVLEDGTALISKTRMFEAIGMQRKGSSRSDSPAFIGAQNLQPFISPKLQELLKGMEFYDGGKLTTAYNADVLTLTCQVYLDARRAGVLHKAQLSIAEVCEMLVIAFSTVGVRAFIYEQLGFEKFKHPEIFKMLVESYIDEKIRPWLKEFPDEFFWQLDRIYGNERTTSRNRPQYYANFIRKYIYQPLEHGAVLKVLDEKVPKDSKGRKTKRLHSATSENVGLPAVRSQLFQVFGVLKSSSNKRVFENNYARMMGNAYQPSLFE